MRPSFKIAELAARVRRLAVVGTLGVAVSCHAADERGLTAHVEALAATRTPDERQTLERIPQADRRLLALRAYLRAGDNLRRRWSWTDEEIQRYTQSPDHARLLEDLDEVQRAFARANPGFELYANTEVRSLDTQIERWNSNPRVGKTASNLYRVAVHAVDRPTPSAQSLEELKELLVSWRPNPVAPLAAPGLSLHGRMRAIDFQIMEGRRIVAATELGAVQRDWRLTGWDRKLRQAVAAAGERFAGPLQSPDEPWHYEYVGRADRRAAR